MVKSQYNIASSNLEQQAQKDVYDAYSNYLLSEMMVNKASDLTTGYKNYVDKTLKNQYDASLYNIDQQLYNDKLTAFSEASDAVAKFNTEKSKEIDKQALNMVGYMQDLFKFATTSVLNDGTSLVDKYETWFKKDKSDNVIGWSDSAKNVFFDINTQNNTETLNDLGKQIYGVMLGSGFDDWAASNYNKEEYNTWLETDRNLFNQALFGQDINPYSGEYGDALRSAYVQSNMPKGSVVATQTALKNYKDIFDKVISYEDGKNSIADEYIWETREDGKRYRTNADAKYTSMSEFDGYYTLKAGSEGFDLISEVKQMANKAYKTKNLKKGDVIKVNKYLLYYEGDGEWAVAKDTPETRKKLEENNIVIGK